MQPPCIIDLVQLRILALEQTDNTWHISMNELGQNLYYPELDLEQTLVL